MGVLLTFAAALNASAASCFVVGQDDKYVDGDAIRYALMNARAGLCDHVNLAGTFNLTVTVPADDITIPLPDGDSMTFFGDFVGPDSPFFWLPPDGVQFFLLDIPGLTITGSSGSHTVLRVDKAFYDSFQESGDYEEAIFDAGTPLFIIAAPNVTIKNLTFDGLGATAFTFWSGWTCLLYTSPSPRDED